MNIGIDIDDTISNTYDTVIPYAQKYTIEDLKKQIEINNNLDLTTHKYTKSLHGWNDLEDEAFWNKYYTQIVENVSIKSLASENIAKLFEKNNIYIITARWDNEKKEIEEITKKWLKKNNIKYNILILNAENKAEIAKKYNIDIFIDDSIKNCEDVSNVGIKTYIMDSKVNQNYNNPKVKRIYSWPHFSQEISKIEKGE